MLHKGLMLSRGWSPSATSAQGQHNLYFSLHEDPTFSIHSLDRTGSAAVYFITLTTRQALARLTQ